jgi:hypothetical protein
VKSLLAGGLEKREEGRKGREESQQVQIGNKGKKYPFAYRRAFFVGKIPFSWFPETAQDRDACSNLIWRTINLQLLSGV